MASERARAAVARYAEWFTRDADAVIDDLETFVQLLSKWNRVQNLVSRETFDDIWTRHIADSLQCLGRITPASNIVDIGSGGGFPAIPLAIALKKANANFVLVEPNARKASFLRTVVRDLALAVRVECRRIDPGDSRETRNFEVITARALAPLPVLCGLVAPLFSSNTKALFHKGREYGEELANSSAFWHYDVVVVPSDTNEHGVLLELTNLRPKTQVAGGI